MTLLNIENSKSNALFLSFLMPTISSIAFELESCTGLKNCESYFSLFIMLCLALVSTCSMLALIDISTIGYKAK